MKTITLQQLSTIYRPTKSLIDVKHFQRSGGWLTNRFFLIREELEPRSSQDYRFKDSDVDVRVVIDSTINKLRNYEEAQVVNHIEVSSIGDFLIKLKSENYDAWVNPRYISYLYQGMEFFKDLKIMIGKDIGDPIVFVAGTDEINALVMGYRNPE